MQDRRAMQLANISVHTQQFGDTVGVDTFCRYGDPSAATGGTSRFGAATIALERRIASSASSTDAHSAARWAIDSSMARRVWARRAPEGSMTRCALDGDMSVSGVRLSA